jgi:hypothetical protein
MKIVEKYHQLSPNLKRIATVVGIIAGIGGCLTTINLIVGVEVRPAWIWEVRDIEHDIIQLKIRIIRGEILENNRMLDLLIETRDERRSRNELIPEWLTNRISDLTRSLRDFETEINILQNTLTNQD